MPNQDFRSEIETVRGLVRSFKENPLIADESPVRVMWQKLDDACHVVERSWSGSYAGWHGSMYFRDFEIPSVHERFSGEWGGINGIPNGWEEKQIEVVHAKIETLVGSDFSVKSFEEKVTALRKVALTLKNEVAITLSLLSLPSALSKEKDLIESIDAYDFGKKKGDYIHDRLPKSLMSRDTEALRQGTFLPSWLYYKCVAIEAKHLYETIDGFLELIDRVVRRLEAKSGTAVTASPLHSVSGLHQEIYEKCHELYENGTLAEAVEKSFKVVRDRLRQLSGYETGTEAFGKGKLFVNGASASNVEHDFNEAVKFLTMAIDKFRNEKSHTSDAEISDPARAFEYLCVSSLAMRLLDNAEVRVS